MDIEISTVMHPDAERNAKGDHPCFLCGKATDGSREVHLVTSGFLVPMDEEVEPDEDQGFFPIGPECAKKLPRENWALTENG